MYVCLCRGVTDKEIRETIAEGASSLEEVMHCTGAGTCCGSCQPQIEEMLEEAQLASPKSRRSLRVLTSAA